MAALPTPEYTFGRLIRAVADTTDSDTDPDAITVSGSGLVLFEPADPQRIAASTSPVSLVKHETIAADLVDGILSVAGQPGVTLWTGTWIVRPGVKTVLDFTPFPIVVTTSHTAANPLQLWTNMGAVIAPDAPVTTLVVPAGGTSGQVLGWTGTQLQWQSAPADPTRIIGAGRPDVTSTLTAPIAAQVAVAPVGAIFSSTDGASVGAWQWQKVASGWVVTFGDTEWLDIRSLLVNGWSASILAIQRTAQTISYAVNGLNAAASTAQTFVAGLPSGFIPGNTKAIVSK